MIGTQKYYTVYNMLKKLSEHTDVTCDMNRKISSTITTYLFLTSLRYCNYIKIQNLNSGGLNLSSSKVMGSC